MGWASRQKRKPLGKHLTGRPRWKCEDKILCEAGKLDGTGSETCPTANFGVCVVLNTWASYML